MDVYIVEGIVYCESCGSDRLEEADPDSPFPTRGPLPQGGPRADHPRHCEGCGTFLENPLTEEGKRYVRNHPVRSDDSPAQKWKEFYDLDSSQN